MSFNTEIKYDDFVGFTFDGIHSSELNVIRTSESNRYTDDLIPSFQDKTVQVGGRDGTYLFGSYYQRKEFPLSIAFDNVSEEDFRRIQNWGADKKIHKLIFDEKPYKYYNVKLSAPPQLKYICFDESEINRERNKSGDKDRRRRIYKGEGTFKFVCYESFARGTIKSEREVVSQQVHHGKIYIDRNATDKPYELKIPDLDNIDTVQLYLSRDFLYNRGEWGAPNLDENGKLAPGQKDPYTGQASTSYYAFQPQKTRIGRDDGNSTAVLGSDYQVYLFPIDLKKGFIGQIDSKTFVTNGRLIDNTDNLYDNHFVERRTEIVQYDPSLKVTYGVSTDNQPINTNVEEYGCYSHKINEYGKWELFKIDEIPESYAIWDRDNLIIKEEYKGKEVYHEIIEHTSIRDKTDAKGNPVRDKEGNIVQEEYIDIDLDTANDYEKIFIVKQATNSFLPIHHSIYFQPNSDCQDYFLECRYIDKDGSSQVIKFEVTVNDNDIFPDGEDKESEVLYYEGLCNNYREWKNVINLPQEEADWKGNEIKIKNCGDIDMPFILVFEKPYGFNENTFEPIRIELEGTDKKLKIKEFELVGDDTGIMIDMELRVIRGFYREKDTTENKIIYTSNIYDRYIEEGDYFYIPVGKQTLKKDKSVRPEVWYEYRYF